MKLANQGMCLKHNTFQIYCSCSHWDTEEAPKHTYREGSTLDQLVNRLASAAWQSSGEPAPVDKEKWRTVARAVYDELLTVDMERADASNVSRND